MVSFPKRRIRTLGMFLRFWVEAEVNFFRRGKLSRRNYLDYLKNGAKSGDMAVLELTFGIVKNWFCYRRKVSDVRIQMLVFDDLKTDACRCHFWNGCTQGSFWATMCATRKAIVTDARNGLLGNGCAQGMGRIPDAHNLHPGCTQPL